GTPVICMFSLPFTFSLKLIKPKEKQREVFTLVEVQPEFPGGDFGRMKYMENNLKYPKQAIKDKAEGKVFVTFIVAEDGSIENIRVVRGVHTALDSAAVAVIRQMPRWTPGNQRGTPVAVQYNMPIKFTLTGKKD
ncbi:MAG TPA: energy transducer TonB, partial [Bacteroidales bacterium]|nr:energy transducer TonB [Bacteroidales bacterium]